MDCRTLKKRINEASNDLDSHKVNVGKNIVERHNDAANKINEAMDRIKKNGERINKTNKTQADVERIIKENSRAMGIGGDNNDVTLDTSNIKETKNISTEQKTLRLLCINGSMRGLIKRDYL